MNTIIRGKSERLIERRGWRNSGVGGRTLLKGKPGKGRGDSIKWEVQLRKKRQRGWMKRILSATCCCSTVDKMAPLGVVRFLKLYCWLAWAVETEGDWKEAGWVKYGGQKMAWKRGRGLVARGSRVVVFGLRSGISKRLVMDKGWE